MGFDTAQACRDGPRQVRTHLVEDAFNGPLSELTPKQRKGVESMTNDIVRRAREHSGTKSGIRGVVLLFEVALHSLIGVFQHPSGLC